MIEADLMENHFFFSGRHACSPTPKPALLNDNVFFPLPPSYESIYSGKQPFK